VIVDTPGLVRGAIGPEAQDAQIELLNTAYRFALQRAVKQSIPPVFSNTWVDCTVHRISPAPGARPSRRPYARTAVGTLP